MVKHLFKGGNNKAADIPQQERPQEVIDELQHVGVGEHGRQRKLAAMKPRANARTATAATTRSIKSPVVYAIKPPSPVPA